MFVPKRELEYPKQHLAQYLDQNGGFLFENELQPSLVKASLPGKLLA